MILVTGGVAQGKSQYAEQLAASIPGPRYYIATMTAPDEESRARVQRHRQRRAGLGFVMLECQTGLEHVQVPPGACVLLECVTNLVANEMFSGRGADAAQAVLAGINRLEQCAGTLIVVTNEVGADGGQYSPEVRAWSAALAQVNRALAQQAARVVELVCGLPLCVKGAVS